MVVGLVAAAIMAGGLALARARPGLVGRLGWWTFIVTTAAIPIVMIGAREGAYNHVAKNLLFFGGVSERLLLRLFPPPTYVLPNDPLFELSGVAQVVPAAIAAWRLVTQGPRPRG